MPRDSSNSYSGIQYTWVLSMATVSMPSSCSQSTSCVSSGVVVPKVRTLGLAPGLAGQQTQCSVLARSMPAACGR